MSYQNVETTAPARLGRYELIGLLAVGGMAEIHLARLAGEAGFEKIVVVKRLLPELVASRAFVAMFLDEGKLVARLDHPNICEVHELGREGAEYFIVMPYLDGVAATELIAQPRDPDRIAQLRVAAGVIVQACAGLDHAHEHVEGLVHRDVSPSNLFVTTAGIVKVLDFGIAKAHGTTATEVGTVKGKTQYMAPEQVMGDAMDRRVDVFALGIVLYELATHQRLFKRSSDFLAAKAIIEEPIPRADDADPAIPKALADVIAKALDRTPAARHATARELGAAIVDAMAPHGGVASASEIAASLAAHHAEELTAQRTRQARVVGGVKAPATVPASRAALLDVAPTGLRATTAAATTGDEAPVEIVRATSSHRVAWLVGAGLLAAAAIAVSVVAPSDRAEPGTRVDPSAFLPKPIEVPRMTPPPAIVPPPAPTDVHADSDSRPKHVVAPVRRVATPEPAGIGFFSIDARPYAEIFVDGKSLGVTPLVHKPLPAGSHELRAVRSDGKTQSTTLRIVKGKTSTPALTW